jgi:hypothetical protein
MFIPLFDLGSLPEKDKPTCFPATLILMLAA